ncbi:hypothetical protein DSO57_1033165 [Entomophthora muscae]|uniref:Uncharacterized protein n=1 Tax=Entomophthora muscae TaxID=34485 RepID=A0ACC2TC52_9FUNG|nr:hypothetical protein DSO57_1033165 [Entomophthora muscae]
MVLFNPGSSDTLWCCNAKIATLENQHSTIQGPVIDFPKFDIVLGLDWLQNNNHHLNWAASVLTIKREGVNHQVYPDSVDQLLGNHVFVHITETLDKRENLKTINWDSCQYKIIHFTDHQDTTTPQDCKVVATIQKSSRRLYLGYPQKNF